MSARRIALGAGGLCLGAALGGIILWFAQRKPQVSPPPLGFAHLPRKTAAVGASSLSSVVVAATGMHLEEAPPEAFWSAYARYCGGWDVVRTVGRGDLKAYSASMLRDPSMAGALRCGRALYQRYGPSLDRHWVSFVEDDKTHGLYVVKLDGLDRLPEADYLEPVDDEPKHLDEVACVVSKEGEGCTPTSFAVAKVDGMPIWLSGSLEALEVFARRFDDEGDDSLSGDVASMAKLHGELSGGYVRTVGDGDGYDSSFTRGFGYIPKLLDDKRIKKFNERVEDDVEAWAQVLEGDPLRGEIKVELVLWAESPDKAKDLMEDLEDVVARLEKRIDEAADTAEDEADKRNDEVGRERAEYELADWRMSVHALAQASLSLDGERVTLRMRQEPTEEQAGIIERYRQWQRDRTDTAVSVVRAMVDDEEIHPDDLGALDPELPKAYEAEPAGD